jgi:hypothetical protein
MFFFRDITRKKNVFKGSCENCRQRHHLAVFFFYGSSEQKCYNIKLIILTLNIIIYNVTNLTKK